MKQIEYGLRYPEGTDHPKDLPLHLKQMVESIAAALAGFDYTGADPNLVLSRVAAIESSLGTTTQWVYPQLAVGVSPEDNPFGYRKVNGVVHLRGRVRAVNDASVIFTMPAGFRIAGGNDNVVPIDASGYLRINIKGNGQLQVIGQPSGAGIHLSLGAINYLAA